MHYGYIFCERVRRLWWYRERSSRSVQNIIALIVNIAEIMIITENVGRR